ncbi:uncharacterized protein PHACADRAFT_247293 [Phanerochaete carnosa HHB-10118-sp]|uniref:PHD-type domain-containing protein n=1 Tax=Phanerochaete carnosa (strain HHB-10118-sp) TaxID=650164 RepID=K5WAN6_PHACS|nr:uncharacterized protein PHACADRAFT_247293 [Phanerochaete carnosa HHB-10118-sp]EKM61003.1 hypothetical protein PHACADRAFT_247293 [Phanerochaete carnosa HHB-10118-sp]
MDPEFFAPSTSSPHQIPQNATQCSPVHPRHKISSLLTNSLPPPRASAASLPHILNSPMSSTVLPADTKFTRASLYRGSGMEGLEALVQAATQERQRLGGEKVQEEPISPSPWSAKPASPVLTPVASNPALSLAANQSLAVTTTHSAGSREYSGPGSPCGARTTSPSPSQPYRSPVHASIPPPDHLTTSLRAVLEELPAEQTKNSASIVMDDAEIQSPLPMRYRSSSCSTHSVHASYTAEESQTPVPPSAEGDAMEVQSEDHKGSEHNTAVLATESHELKSARLAYAAKSPIQVHRIEPLSPSPAPVSSPGPPLQQTPTRLASSMPLHSATLKSEAIDSLVVPATSDSSDGQAQEAKLKANIGKSDGAALVKLKGRVKHREKSSKSRRTSHSRDSSKKDDTDDWFLEQFGEAEPKKMSELSPNTRPVSSSSRLAKTPDGEMTHHWKKLSASPSEGHRHNLSSRKPLARQSRSPTPHEILEAELDDVPLAPKRSPSPPETTAPWPLLPNLNAQTLATSTNLDLDTELERTLQDESRAPLPPAKPKPKPRPKTKPKPEIKQRVDMDVEDELLALLDDGSDEHKEKHRSEYAHSLLAESNLTEEVAERVVAKHVMERNVHGVSVVASPIPEISSLMPPPGSRGVSQVRETSVSRKDRDEREPTSSGPTAVGGTPAMTPTPTPTPGPSGPSKSKEASKKKAPPKPRGKVTTAIKPKAKSSVVKERSTTPATPPHLVPNASDGPPVAGKSKKMQGSLTAKRAVSAAGGTSRSRSTSVMPGESEASGRKRSGQQVQDEKDEKEEEEREVDDRLYCVCRTPYDEDRVMIACDRCDEWYHTQCVNMPDLEVDLVDQFICPICVANNPHLTLRTTYKKRCLAGLAHSRPTSQHACHKPARGAFSKYCSDECGVRYMRERIERYVRDNTKNVTKANKEVKEEESMRSLWEGVKSAGQREAVVLRVLDGVDEKGEPRTEIVVPRLSKHARLISRLEMQLANILNRRDGLKAEDEIVAWREAVIGYAAQRAEGHGECSWDGRLLWSADEVREYGAEVVDAYERVEMQGDGMAVDGRDNESCQVEEGGWWCTGKRKCDRHAGWQKLRQAEIDLEKELFEAELERLTTREREIRKRIEDIQAAHPNIDFASLHPAPALDSHAARSEPIPFLNGVQVNTLSRNGDVDDSLKLNGVNGVDGGEKKGKKRKVDAR